MTPLALETRWWLESLGSYGGALETLWWPKSLGRFGGWNSLKVSAPETPGKLGPLGTFVSRTRWKLQRLQPLKVLSVTGSARKPRWQSQHSRFGMLETLGNLCGFQENTGDVRQRVIIMSSSSEETLPFLLLLLLFIHFFFFVPKRRSQMVLLRLYAMWYY